MTIRIVTDSTADVTPEMAHTLGITVVPLTVFFDDEAYLDHIELDNATFYRKLQTNKSIPRTSQPSPAAFQEAYKRLIDEGADGIISIHLSSALSGTYQSACTALDTLPKNTRQIPIEIIDSQTVSAGILLGLKRAVEWAREGQSVEEIKTKLEDFYSRTRLLAVLDTLEYVRRGGRIGGAKALLGNMLSVKPIISLKEGSVIPVEQPRTRNKALARLVQLALESGPIEEIAIIEADETIGQQLAETLKTSYPHEVQHYKLGPVLGTHAGPGAAGLFFVNNKQ